MKAPPPHSIVLSAEEINYIALDVNDDIVREEVSNSLPVFKGDASQVSTLEAIGADRALIMVVTVNICQRILNKMKGF